jgi:hypothetical protein
MTASDFVKEKDTVVKLRLVLFITKKIFGEILLDEPDKIPDLDKNEKIPDLERIYLLGIVFIKITN